MTHKAEITHAPQAPRRAPAFIRYSGPIARRLLRLGVPMGPNTLLTVRGRVSGKPHTTPLALVEFEGRRWVVGTFGDVNWVRNLRAAGEAEVRVGGRQRHVRATELAHDEAAAFFRETLVPYLRQMPLVWRALTRTLVGLAAPEVLTDPNEAARRRPVFELTET